MISYKKLFVLIFSIVLVYCFWPRNPNLLRYNPAKMAQLQAESWDQSHKKQWFGHLVTNYRIFQGQYGFSPYAATIIAFDMTRAFSIFGDAIENTTREAASTPLRVAYETIKKDTKKTYRPEEVASLELAAWAQIRDGEALETAAQTLSKEFSLLYGGGPKKYLPAARHFTAAMEAQFSDSPEKVKQELKEGWTALQQSAALDME